MNWLLLFSLFFPFFYLAQSNISARLFVTPRMARLRRRPGYEIQTHISLVPGNLPSVRDQNGPDWKVLCDTPTVAKMATR